jgi:hypothetical protein
MRRLKKSRRSTSHFVPERSCRTRLLEREKEEQGRGRKDF